MVSAPPFPYIRSRELVPDMVSAVEVPKQVVLTTHWMLAASATPPATNTIRAMVETTTTMRLIRVLPFHEGRGDLPRLKLINEGSLLLVSADVCAIEQ